MRKVLLSLVFGCLVLFFSCGVFAGNAALESRIDKKAHELATRFEDQTKTKRVLKNLVNRLGEVRPRVRSQHRWIVDYYIAAIQKELNAVSSAPAASVENVSYAIANVDMNKVKQTWLERYNAERRSKGLGSLVYDARLDATAQEWAQVLTARNAGRYPVVQTVHERNSGDGFYNYKKITQWFADRGVVAQNVGGTTHTENIGRGVVNCKSGDCTQAMINAIKTTFDFFMSEKAIYQKNPNSYSAAHYRSIIQPNFDRIGMGLVVQDGRYWIVIHYITDFE